MRCRRLIGAVIMRDDTNKLISPTPATVHPPAAVKRIDSVFTNLVFDLNCH